MRSPRLREKYQRYRQKYKLKEAVVLLTDISKTDVYEKYVSQVSKGSDSPTKLNVDSPKKSNREENTITVAKENVEKQIESSSDVANKSDNSSLQNSKLIVSSESGSASVKFKSLTELAEGCSFSKILARFSIKHKNNNPETFVSNNNKASQKLNLEVHLNNEICVEVNLNDSIEENTGEDPCSHFSQEPENSNPIQRNEDSTSLNCNNNVQPSDCGKATAESNEMLGVGSENEINSTAVSDVESSFNLPQTNDAKVYDPNFVLRTVTLQDIVGGFRIGYIQEEMNRRGLLNSAIAKKQNKHKRRRKAKDASSSSTTPKKAKVTNNSPEKTKDSPITEDYIPLNAPGPTKFLVAPLNKVTPYKSHSAKDFKNQMLFGDRVKRFSSNKQLRTFQMKQSARKLHN